MKMDGMLIAVALVAASTGWGSPAAAGVAPPATWMKDLPSAPVVSSVVHGSDVADTRARAEAALRVMMDVIEGLSGVPHMGASVKSFAEPAAGRWLEYLSAMSAGRTPSTYPGRPALRYYGNLDFHEEILAKLVSPAARAAYEASGRYRELVQLMPPSPSAQARAAATPARPSGPFSPATDPDCLVARRLLDAGLPENAEERRLKCEAKKQAAAETAAQAAEAAAQLQVVRLHAKDLAKARAAGVSTRVFDLPLGEPLTIPECGPGLVAALSRKVEKTCRNTLMSMLTGWTDIALGRDKRPSWFTSAGVTLDRGVLLGIAVATTDEDADDQLAALRTKYGRPTRVEKNTGALEWELPGLFVRYELRSAIPPVPDTVSASTIGGMTYFHVGPNAFSSYRRDNLPNLFILTESLREANVADARRRKEQDPGL
jgi:hypothetical protein